MRAAATLAALAAAALATGGCLADVESGERHVIGGEPTPPGLYPATGSLTGRFNGQTWSTCTGTLVAPDVVLTAAHCIEPAGAQVPGFTLALEADGVADSEVHAGASVHPHPQYDGNSDPGNGIGQWYDIGVLRLAQPVTNVPHAILPTPSDGAQLAPGMTVELVGYGMTHPDAWDGGGVKHHGQADLVQVGAHELLIAQPGQQQNCFGDSGGPGFVTIGGQQLLVGVVSRGPTANPRCDEGGIDTRVDPYLEWLHSVAEIPCGSGLSAPCVDPTDPDEPGGPGGDDPDGDDPNGDDPADPDAPSDPDGAPGADDGGPSDDTDGAGCGCRAGDAGGSAGLAALLALAALGLRRRRGRARGPTGAVTGS